MPPPIHRNPPIRLWKAPDSPSHYAMRSGLPGPTPKVVDVEPETLGTLLSSNPVAWRMRVDGYAAENNWADAFSAHPQGRDAANIVRGAYAEILLGEYLDKYPDEHPQKLAAASTFQTSASNCLGLNGLVAEELRWRLPPDVPVYVPRMREDHIGCLVQDPSEGECVAVEVWDGMASTQVVTEFDREELVSRQSRRALFHRVRPHSRELPRFLSPEFRVKFPRPSYSHMRRVVSEADPDRSMAPEDLLAQQGMGRDLCGQPYMKHSVYGEARVPETVYRAKGSSTLHGFGQVPARYAEDFLARQERLLSFMDTHPGIPFDRTMGKVTLREIGGVSNRFSLSRTAF